MRIAFLVAILALASPVVVQDPTEQELERWFSAIVPAPEELAFREIPWRATFWDGLLEAQERDMPVLLWAMNGHPLGCT